MTKVTQLDLRAQKSRLALLDAGIELLIQNPTASLSEVAAFAGVGRATLYRHFDSREALIRAIAQDSLEKTDEVLAPLRERKGADKLNAKELISESFRVITPLARHYHFLLSLWGVAGEDPEVMAIYNKQLAQLSKIIEDGKKQKSINKKLSTDWLVALYDSILYTSWYMLGQGHMTEADVVEHAVISFFNGAGVE